MDHTTAIALKKRIQSFAATSTKITTTIPYLYKYTDKQTYIHKHTYTHTHIHTYTHTYIHINKHSYRKNLTENNLKP